MTVASYQTNVQRERPLASGASKLPALSLPLPGQPQSPRSDYELELRRMHKLLARLRDELGSLRETETQHRLLFEKSPNPKFVCDGRTLRILAVNEAASRRYGYTRGELLGLTAKDLCVAAAVPAFLGYCQRVVQVGAVPVGDGRVQIRHVTKTAEAIEVELTAVPVSFRGRNALLILAQDITARTRAEQRLRAQHATTRALAESATVAEASPRILQAIGVSLGCDRGELWRVNPDATALRCVQVWTPGGVPASEMAPHRRALGRGQGIPGIVWLKNKPVWIKDLTEEPHLGRTTPAVRRGLRTALAFPIRLNHEVLGVIVVFMREVRGLDKHLFQMLKDITSQIGQVMGRRRLERQMLEISEREQQRIGQDLHDGLCQQLAGISYLASNLHSNLAARSAAEAAAADRIRGLLEDTIVQARQLARGLNPVRLEAIGLMAALGDLASSIESLFSIACRFECDHHVLVHDHEGAIHLYRIAQEAIHNAIKHGKATQIGVALARREDALALSVRDNGRGLPESAPEREGLGMENMRYRARSIGAQLRIERRAGGGTLLTCTVPRRKEGRV